MSEAMDVYSSRMGLPFDLAAWCRSHKFSVEAVAYARAIRAIQDAEDRVREAQDNADQADEALAAALQAVRARMARDGS